MSVRVLWVVKGLGPGGAETLLAAAARAHDPSRVHLECAFVVPWKDHLAAELEAAGVRTHCLSVQRRDRRWPQRLAALVRGGGWDVVHVHSPLPGSVARAAVRTMPASRRPRIVSTEHNRWETHRLATRSLNHVSSRFDDAAFAVTAEVKASMRGPVADLAVTVRHGIDVEATAAARGDREAVRAELGLGRDELVAGTVANFRPQKDYPNLLRAARLLADRGVPVRFVAVGQGPQEEEVRGLADELGLGDRVLLTGYRADAVRVMAACDVFAMASQWEGLPVALMEALALGLPVVATAVGGIAEELHDGVDALLVPPGDAEALAAAIERVVGDAELRARLAAAAAARAPEFDVSRTARLLEDTYERLAASRPHVDDAEPAPPRRERSAATPDPLDIRHATVADRPEILDLLRRSLGGDEGDTRYPALFAWKHDENRFGPSPMWVATDAERIVAFRTLMRWEFERGGRVLRAVRAVDTATDPDYQGRGLFRTLTLQALEEMRVDGVDLVFNTPNSQSRPGYLKMGWREVGRLPAAVRFVGPAGAATALRSKVPAERWSQPLTIGDDVAAWLDAGGPAMRIAPTTDVRELRTRVDDTFLRWRYATPLLHYRVIDDGDAAVIVRARRRGQALELAVVAGFGDAVRCDRIAGRAARQAGADYAIRIGQPQMSAGFARLPGGGPILTWRAVNDAGMPPLVNWALSLGDVELF